MDLIFESEELTGVVKATNSSSGFKDIIYNFLQSVRLLADGCTMFNEHCAKGIEAKD